VGILLDQRIAFLEAAQNRDGGWGYFPGKSSWLEPTVYVLSALRTHSPGAITDPAWKFVRGLQLPCGAWAPSSTVPEPHWTTSLCIGLYSAAGIHDEGFDRGLAWLLEQKGDESGFPFRLGQWLHPGIVDFDPTLNGWPWWPGTSSWVEPTAHALMALKRPSPSRGNPELQRRVALGERMLLNRRCRDGGWNHGDKRVLRVDQPSYPESTAIALLALIDVPSLDLSDSVRKAAEFRKETKSPLARAWLRICLQAYGSDLPPDDSVLIQDTLVTALEVIACDRSMG
jgi:hypothetical protein